MNIVVFRRLLGIALAGIVALFAYRLVVEMNIVAHESAATRAEHSANGASLIERLLVLAWCGMMVRVSYMLARHGEPVRSESALLLLLHLLVLLAISGLPLPPMPFIPSNWSQAAALYMFWGVILVTVLDMLLPPHWRRRKQTPWTTP